MRRYTKKELKKILPFVTDGFNGDVYHNKRSFLYSQFAYYVKDKELKYYGADGNSYEGIKIKPIPKLMWLMGYRIKGDK